ncbi:hypothetical protein [Erythrobacter litoralis]|uniref:Uncharacterized protein n=1 Tax=Erythrobacter litoralis (strain HTCC2594) TaxID=314225 RepID=Q2N9G6_ERYLH|nr:hypothetical protein [Erythrobacter litoralis]ABC63675.1 hypothetical protein ELI_07915 [Erythrobacter litoralis HTCC2594]
MAHDDNTLADDGFSNKPDSEDRDLRWFLAGLAVVVVAFALLWIFSTSDGREYWSPYWFSGLIGVFVGATELIARYRDAPFRPFQSIAGLLYVGINGLAAWLAYYLILASGVPIESTWAKILTAGLGAMAFFRSGIFNARIGDKDVPIGPNIVLEIFLSALDRNYDRQRAAPRSAAVAELMSDLSFDETSVALPAICFNLMQNVSEAEKTAIGNQVKELAESQMSDEAKSMTLGLALFDVVGEKTLRAAVASLGKTVRGFKQLPDAMLDELAKVDPATVLSTLPAMCNELAAKRDLVEDPNSLVSTIANQPLSDEAKALLVLYKMVRQYGETSVMRVLVAMG